ncbi:hypothetical protein BST40_03690 [Mycobacterium persicum]|uniref:Adenylate cyclase 2 n=1 Tax=Mycobacterium persicum TaxID=1487726 RepID=A0AB38UV71_9MYCO|nr:adenylate/guanylate cyclase domain-containing protein [Mycobacterium persicum]ORB57804.1 hypothetical protein BST40_03690 [Mycobacterium persicum]ORB88526.1 hypothetical protein B1T49_03695 [Mycobacterium persicum]VAZ84607.1 Adenylate cyclase 2 [Mycobacterium persicum]
MAVFGAPAALEDHALRACLAAVAIQREIQPFAGDIERDDGVALRLRVGLNSGQVIAGEINSGPAGYTAIGEPVVMAQRMESAAPPGGVMISESTGRLLENAAVLRDYELGQIKGTDVPVPAHRLLAVGGVLRKTRGRRGPGGLTHGAASRRSGRRRSDERRSHLRFTAGNGNGPQGFCRNLPGNGGLASQ